MKAHERLGVIVRKLLSNLADNSQAQLVPRCQQDILYFCNRSKYFLYNRLKLWTYSRHVVVGYVWSHVNHPRVVQDCLLNLLKDNVTFIIHHTLL